MNPAALRSELGALAPRGTVIANEDAFTKRNLQKAGYDANPLEDGSLEGFHLIRIPMTSLTARATEAMERVSTRDAGRAKNLFALGVVSWLYDRPTEPTERWIRGKFGDKPGPLEANLAAFRAGWNFGETSELVDVQYRVDPATDVPAGTYRNVNGTTATALGLIAASVRSGLPLVLASYPITPASELLHELARHQDMGVRTIQAEDEIAAAGMALGAAFGGALGVTATSGPGLDLKTETIGLAVALELPLVVIDVQRAGPSTGMPTKTEQSDLLAAIHGRHGESPLPVIAASTPGQCFEAAYEAARIAVTYRTPVILLSDLFLANSSEPWRIPDADALPPIDPAFAQPGEPFSPYARDEKGARPWAIPGTPGLEHRIGGLEKEDVHRRHLLRRRQPRAHDRHPGRQGRGDGGRPAVARGRRRPRRRAARARLGLEPRRDPRRRPPRARQRPRGRHRPPAPPAAAAVGPRRAPAPLRARARAGDEQRPAREPAARRVPRRRRELRALEGRPLFAAELERELEERL